MCEFFVFRQCRVFVVNEDEILPVCFVLQNFMQDESKLSCTFPYSLRAKREICESLLKSLI